MRKLVVLPTLFTLLLALAPPGSFAARYRTTNLDGATAVAGGMGNAPSQVPSCLEPGWEVRYFQNAAKTMLAGRAYETCEWACIAWGQVTPYVTETEIVDCANGT